MRVSVKIYPLDVVLSTCYLFLDRAYIFLDGDPGIELIVRFQLKKGGGDGARRRLIREFQNELVSQALRHRIARENRKVRELIINQALMGAVPKTVGTEIQSDEELEKILAEAEPGEGKGYLDDPLGIATTWEEKYEKSEQEESGKPADAPPPQTDAGGAQVQQADLPPPEHSGSDPKV